MRGGIIVTVCALAIAACDNASNAPASRPAPTTTAVPAPAVVPDTPPPSGYDESLFTKVPAGTLAGQILDFERRPARDVVVYVKKGPARAKPAARSPAVVDQKNKTFMPRVLPIVVGTRVEFKNSDPVLHNVYSRADVKKFDLGMFSKSETKSVAFDTVGRIDVFCSIHTNMHVVILVLANDQFATSDASGFFAIPDLQPGTYTLAIWDEVASEREVTVEVAADKPAILKHQLVKE
ncbi:MAG TPA: hypothetical protein VIV11_07545 [Kofleriaceae bacterium]